LKANYPPSNCYLSVLKNKTDVALESGVLLQFLENEKCGTSHVFLLHLELHTPPLGPGRPTNSTNEKQGKGEK
jgi:hypothetical protein